MKKFAAVLLMCATLLLLCATLFLLCSCTNERPIGTWRASISTSGAIVEVTFTFERDNTGSFLFSIGGVSNQRYYFDYSVEGDVLTLTGDDADDPIICSFSMENNVLTISSDEFSELFSKPEIVLKKVND